MHAIGAWRQFKHGVGSRVLVSIAHGALEAALVTIFIHRYMKVGVVLSLGSVGRSMKVQRA